MGALVKNLSSPTYGMDRLSRTSTGALVKNLSSPTYEMEKSSRTLMSVLVKIFYQVLLTGWIDYQGHRRVP